MDQLVLSRTNLHVSIFRAKGCWNARFFLVARFLSTTSGKDIKKEKKRHLFSTSFEQDRSCYEFNWRYMKTLMGPFLFFSAETPGTFQKHWCQRGRQDWCGGAGAKKWRAACTGKHFDGPSVPLTRPTLQMKFVTPPKCPRMSPENQWFEDVFPIECWSLLRGHVSFPGCTLPNVFLS